MSHELVNAWTAVNEAPYILEGDKPCLNSDNSICVDENELLESPEFLNNSHKFFLNLIPIPYAGRIFDGSVFILMLNPGLIYLDIYAEEHSFEYKSALQTQLNGRCPNPYLDPRFYWTGGFTYWTGKLRDHIRELGQQFGKSPREALDLMASEVVFLELVPYHSREFRLGQGTMRRLESVKLIQRFLKDRVLPRAARNECTVVIPRGARMWDVDDAENVTVYAAGQSRGAHMGINTAGGKAIWERLQTAARTRWTGTV